MNGLTLVHQLLFIDKKIYIKKIKINEKQKHKIIR